jgi:hypothetical protein
LFRQDHSGDWSPVVDAVRRYVLCALSSTYSGVD